MAKVKNNNYYIEKIKNDLNFLIRHTKNVTEEELKVNELLLDSIMFWFIQISENVKLLSNTFKNTHNYIPWKSIIGFRNRIVHNYENVDLKIVYDVVTIDILELIELFNEFT